MLLLNNRPIEHLTFSGGEFQVKMPLDMKEERVILTWKPVNASDLTLLIMTVNSLQHMGINDIDLDIMYLPYARQDRVCSPGEAHGLEAICKLLDYLDIMVIRVWDPHNEKKTIDLLKNTVIRIVGTSEIFLRFKILDDFDLSNLIICAPDKGAWQRVTEVTEEFKLADPLLMKKKRCPETGEIKGISMDNSYPVNGYNVLIIDDICDGGRTFTEAAQLLKERGAEKLYLYVTHGIFSKGLDLLGKFFEHIYCHHVLDDEQFKSNDKLTILREFPSE